MHRGDILLTSSGTSGTAIIAARPVPNFDMSGIAARPMASAPPPKSLFTEALQAATSHDMERIANRFKNARNEGLTLSIDDDNWTALWQAGHSNAKIVEERKLQILNVYDYLIVCYNKEDNAIETYDLCWHPIEAVSLESRGIVVGADKPIVAYLGRLQYLVVDKDNKIHRTGINPGPQLVLDPAKEYTVRAINVTGYPRNISVMLFVTSRVDNQHTILLFDENMIETNRSPVGNLSTGYLPVRLCPDGMLFRSSDDQTTRLARFSGGVSDLPSGYTHHYENAVVPDKFVAYEMFGPPSRDLSRSQERFIVMETWSHIKEYKHNPRHERKNEVAIYLTK